MYAAPHSAARRILMALAVLGLLVVGSVQAVHGQQPTAVQEVTVQRGDTVWSIAVERYPGADPRQKVGEIMRANGLSDPTLQVGERLKLP